jgi:hypothetical protein
MSDEEKQNQELKVELIAEGSKTNIPTPTVSPAYVSYYANSIKLMATPFDVRLIFGELGPGRDFPTVVDEQKVSIVMSYEHAKAMMLILAKNLQNREKAFGPIASVPTDQATKNKQ